MKISMILVVALVSLIAADAVAQTGACTRKDSATRAYWPTFGYIPGGPYVYVPPVDGLCRRVRAVTYRGRRSHADRCQLVKNAKSPLVADTGSSARNQQVRAAANVPKNKRGDALDGVCARRRTERQVGTKEWFPDRTKEWTESNPCASFS
jgi:hypothetical protein